MFSYIHLGFFSLKRLSSSEILILERSHAEMKIAANSSTFLLWGDGD